MYKNLFHFIEVVGIFGLMGSIPFVAWTKMTLGAMLACAGTFLSPIRSATNPAGGTGAIEFGTFKFTANGGLKFVMVLGGVALLIGAALDTREPAREEYYRKLGKPLPPQALELKFEDFSKERILNPSPVDIAPLNDDDSPRKSPQSRSRP